MTMSREDDVSCSAGREDTTRHKRHPTPSKVQYDGVAAGPPLYGGLDQARRRGSVGEKGGPRNLCCNVNTAAARLFFLLACLAGYLIDCLQRCSAAGRCAAWTLLLLRAASDACE